MIKAIVCLGLNADVRYVPTLGFGTGSAPVAIEPLHIFVLLGVGS